MVGVVWRVEAWLHCSGIGHHLESLISIHFLLYTTLLANTEAYSLSSSREPLLSADAHPSEHLLFR